jgi:PST family polysaccharide transporter
MLEEDKKSYKQNLKATSLFGGVQIYSILIQIIRSKFVAVLLGPEGMGITGLLTSTTGLITGFTNMGLGTTAVRDIALANGTGDSKRIALVVGVFRRIVWVTGSIAAVICILLAPLLSRIAFGNSDYTIAFIILSCTLLFAQLTSGQTALLQGMQKYSYMAKSALWGSTIGLFVTVPLYYIFGINGIVPVLVMSSLISLFFSYRYSHKIKIEKIIISKSDIKQEGGAMLKTGFFLCLQGLLPLTAGYLVRLYISNYGNIADVGLYNAGFAIVDTYVGLVFTAMAADYYPQLSKCSSNPIEFNKLINQQIEIGLLVLSPLIISFIVFIKPIITVLYSSKFIPIEGMIYWAIFAIFFKVCSWGIAFTFLAKRDTRVFFFNELTVACYGFGMNILAYHFWGLTGLGISFFVKFILYFIQIWVVCSKRYHIKLNFSLLKIFVSQFILACTGISLVLFSTMTTRYIGGCMLLLLSCIYSYKELDKRIELSKLIKSKLKRY